MNETTVSFSCVACGKRFTTPSHFAGKKGKCGKCGAELIVPPPKPIKPAPQSVGFGCRLCGTRLDAPLAAIGKKMKCPDCHTLTVVPPLPAPVTKRLPAAIEGDDYQLYEGENQPRGIDLARAAPPSIAFQCRRCQTHLTAEATRAGEPVKCPDCGAETPVPTARPTASRAVVPNAMITYDVLPNEVAPPQQSLFEQYVARPPAGYRHLNEPDDKPQRGAEQVERPASTAGWGVGLFAGMARTFATTGVISAWLGLSAGLGVVVLLVLTLFGLLQSGVDEAVVGGVLLMGTVIGATLVWYGVAAAIFWGMLDDAAVGARRVRSWPSIDPTEWGAPALQLLVACVVASIPGAVLGPLMIDAFQPLGPLSAPAVWVAAGVWLTLPWVLLSQMDVESPWGVFSPGLVRTLRHAPATWLAFYTVTGALAVLTAVALAVATKRLGGWALPATTPLAVAAGMLYAWLVGRLAWVAGAATPLGPINDAQP